MEGPSPAAEHLTYGPGMGRAAEHQMRGSRWGLVKGTAWPLPGCWKSLLLCERCGPSPFLLQDSQTAGCGEELVALSEVHNGGTLWVQPTLGSQQTLMGRSA